MAWGWQLRGACAGEDVGVFFAPDGMRGAEKVLYEAAAKDVCRGCPVREACLEEAIARGEYGVWGGTDEVERRRIRRARQASTA